MTFYFAQNPLGEFVDVEIGGGLKKTAFNTLALNLADNSGLDLTNGLKVDQQIQTTSVVNNKTYSLQWNQANMRFDPVEAFNLTLQNNSGLENPPAGLAILIPPNSGLQKTNDGLKVETGVGIKNNNGLAIDLQALSGLEVNSAGLTLDLQPASGLQVTNGGLKVETGVGIKNSNGLSIDLQALSGLEVNSAGLTLDLQPASGLQVTNEGLNIDLTKDSGLQKTNNGLKVETGVGIKNNNGLSIDLQALSGLEVNSAGLTLNIQLSSGLQVTSTGLNIDLTNDSGLQKTNDGLKVRLGNNLSLDSQGRIAASVTSGSGVVIAPVDPGGLKLDSQSRISLGYSTGLTVDNNGNLAVRATRGVTFFGGNVAVDTGFGLGISNDNKVAVNLPSSSGLISNANGLAIHVGNGLRINSGNALDLDHRFGTGARKLTGEYIDGKRIYKKYYNFRMPSTNQGDITIESDPCYMIIDYGGVIQRTSDSGQWHMIRDIYTGVGSHESLFFINTNSKIYLYRNVTAVAADYRGRNCRTWITYAVN